ncbi:MAG: major facilitator superfamily 1 [Thermoleophilia bacterium]|nr:major facilitator superfamily 1 [Thermoleophilia bacterium]
MNRRSTTLLIAGSGASLFGDGMFVVAIGFAVLACGGGSGALGVILLAGVGTIFACILPAGVFVDRASRRLVVGCADLARGTLQLVAAYIVSMDHAQWWYLLPTSILFGAATALYQPASMSLVAEVVPSEQLEQVNGTIQALRGLGLVLGGAIAGIVVARSGPVPVMVIDAATFLLCALCILGITTRRDDERTPARPQTERDVRRDLREAVAVVRENRWLRHGLLLITGFVVVSYGPIQVIGPEAARDAAGAAGVSAAELWSWISAATAVGIIVGGVTAFVRPPGAMMRIVRVLLVVGGLGPLALSAGVEPVLTLPGFAAIGGAMGLFTAGWESAKQSRVDAGMLARIASLDMFAQLVGMLAGVAAAALLATFVSADAVLVWVGVGCVLLAGTSLLSRPLTEIFHVRAGERARAREATAAAATTA